MIDVFDIFSDELPETFAMEDVLPDEPSLVCRRMEVGLRVFGLTIFSLMWDRVELAD